MSMDTFSEPWREIVRKANTCPFRMIVVQSLVRRPGRESLDIQDRIVLSNHLSWELGIEMSLYDQLRSVAYNWTTVDAVGKASVNIFACFGWPLLFRHHIVKQMFLYDNGTSRQVKCEKPPTLSVFAKDEHSSTKSTQKGTPRRVVGKNSMERYRLELSKIFFRPVLSIGTVVVKSSIGACSRRNPPQDDNKTGCLELVLVKYGRRESML